MLSPYLTPGAEQCFRANWCKIHSGWPTFKEPSAWPDNSPLLFCSFSYMLISTLFYYRKPLSSFLILCDLQLVDLTFHSRELNLLSFPPPSSLILFIWLSVQFSSVAQSCPTLCDPVNRSTPGLPAHHHLPEFTQTHVHRVGDAIQPSHPLSSPSPLAPNCSQHQSLFQ